MTLSEASANLGPGRAHGWSVWPDQKADPPTWRWRAWGRLGSMEGTGTNETNCEYQARLEMDRLK